MEIVYIWIYDNELNSEISFNLITPYIFSFDGESTLNYEKNENYINDFYLLEKSNVRINFSAIVGSNGTGKTTILQKILKAIVDKEDGNKNFRNLVVTYDNETNLFNYSLVEDNNYYIGKVDFNKRTTFVINKKNDKVDESTFYSNRLMSEAYLISNIFDGTEHLYNEISTRSKVHSIIKTIENEEDYRIYLRSTDSVINVNLLKVLYSSFGKHDIRIPRKVKMYVKTNEYIYKKIYQDMPLIFKKRINKDNIFSLMKKRGYPDFFHLNQLEKFLPNLIKNNASVKIVKLITNIIAYNCQLVYLSCDNNIKNKLKYVSDEEMLIDIYNKCDSLKAFIEEALDGIKEIYILGSSEFNYEGKYFEDLKNELFYFDSLAKSKRFLKTHFQIDLEENDVLDRLNYLEEISRNQDKIKLLEITWDNFSSGEIAMVNIFSAINQIFDNIQGADIKCLVLLIDEPELYFHPQWQKNFIWLFIELISLLKRHFQDLDPEMQIQVVMATHSPFLLSDIPTDRVLFLERKEDGKVITNSHLENFPSTFGANIHELYSHSFFLKGGLMGEFAKQKINHLAGLLLDYVPGKSKIDWDKLLKEINLVGEPILREHLFRLYNEKRLMPEVQKVQSVQDEVNTLHKRLNKLSEEIKRMNSER